MKIVTHEIEIHAPIERVFDLARSVNLHVKSVENVQEEIVGEIKRGLVQLGDEITWHGRYLGFMHTVTFRITAWNPPWYFCNSLVKGLFLKMDHHYSFHAAGDVTVMSDVLNYVMPYGFMGQIFDSFLMRPHLRHFLAERARFLKTVAEGDEWQRYLNAEKLRLPSQSEARGKGVA